MPYRWDSQAFIVGARSEGRSESTIQACLAAATAVKRKHPDLPIIFTLNHLAHLADVNADFLQEVAHRKIDPYRVFRVKKRGVANAVPAPPRRYRTICVPDPKLMRVQRWIAQNILQATPSHHASFAFTRDRDLVDAAKKHAGAKWVVKMDVRHFFESIFEDSVYQVFRSFGYGALISFQMARICTRLADHNRNDARALLGRGGRRPYRQHSKGHLPQGAPTSPMLANRVVETLDQKLDLIAITADWAYSRYADDLAFSRITTTTRRQAMSLVKKVEAELAKFGLETHRQKTTIVSPGGRKVLLGVLIDTDKPRLTKNFRNNIETHLYALTSQKIGPEQHRLKRNFVSLIGMRRHILGLIAFAHQVDETYAAKLYTLFNTVNWNR
ncbi:RNA-directed DNA polymerase [Mesorhizobium sp. WSM4307]|nr:RNA-directed DNA polymerase [Mesorhizobium sp. WSM4311]TRC77692.1 RNA-directed DNA polymerase [Mesorhizobium sp. WSM4310]TRC78085.1 RNA-directed DNA polymerase [Mesorhizobium sp. WSM4315]TRC79274.1 RNA-directed DNA polymerase [Mesorhizobium sp. WSM4307]TRD00252.1 RNA-directed DNA polymerase [Mesorhizobium sp. WSM4305]